MSNELNLVGKSYTFEDGSHISVIQLKNREDGMWVHYEISINSSLPRKLVMPLNEFINTYEHLFKD
jgi:hypothetical protein